MIRPAFALLLLNFLLLGASVLSAQTNAPSASPAPVTKGGVTFQNGVVYGKGGTTDLLADIAWPNKATAPTPAVIHIHGGGWAGGDRRWQGPLGGFAQHGYFAASIEYRMDWQAKWPAQIQDCKCAVRWLRANAAKYNVDPNRIGVIGESAGGHLVACLGTMANEKEYEGDGGWPGVSSAVQAVVDFYGPTDLTRADIYTSKAIQISQGLFGMPYAQNPALWKSASPVYYVAAGDPPVLMVHGDVDPLVPLAQSQVFADALTKAGVPNQLLVIHNGGHGLGPMVKGEKITPGWDVITKTFTDFFDKNLAAR
jgi:acetyl esterase/lipase